MQSSNSQGSRNYYDRYSSQESYYGSSYSSQEEYGYQSQYSSRGDVSYYGSQGGAYDERYSSQGASHGFRGYGPGGYNQEYQPSRSYSGE